MLQRLKNRANEDDGFTLVELLVVILIIGILAAIALPTFLGQSDKAKDSSAKSNARNMVSQVESCYATEQTYANCTTAAGTALNTDGLANTTVATSTGGYTVAATSDSGNIFRIVKNGSSTTRGCTRTKADAGCPASTNW